MLRYYAVSRMDRPKAAGPPSIGDRLRAGPPGRERYEDRLAARSAREIAIRLALSTLAAIVVLVVVFSVVNRMIGSGRDTTRILIIAVVTGLFWASSRTTSMIRARQAGIARRDTTRS